MTLGYYYVIDVGHGAVLRGNAGAISPTRMERIYNHILRSVAPHGLANCVPLQRSAPHCTRTASCCPRTSHALCFIGCAAVRICSFRSNPHMTSPLLINPEASNEYKLIRRTGVTAEKYKVYWHTAGLHTGDMQIFYLIPYPIPEWNAIWGVGLHNMCQCYTELCIPCSLPLRMFNVQRWILHARL